MRPIFLLLFSFAALTVQAQNALFFQEQLVVTANSLNLREAPDANSKKVASLTQGTLLQFLEAWNDGQYTQIDTTDENSPMGRWLKVRTKNHTGWVFDVYVSGTTELYYENVPQFDMKSIAPLFWYGVYARDSFSDEIRKVQVRLAEEMNPFYGANVKMLKTNQKEPSKFLIASHTPLTTGYCGPLGVFDPDQMFFTKALGPGTQLSIYPGNDMNDTIVKPSYGLAATGCARFEENFVRIFDYQLTLLDYMAEPMATQDLTPWVRTEFPETNPSVDLLWFGDLDHDNKPDAIIQDCPYEVGCRASLFLSSKARQGEYLRKVCEYYWPEG
ncbi:MAG: SH3 domain-containing protein [Chitinophagales bacterium]|nr:SH3 domain-containing protein [Chitinophagales bacterium]